MTHADASRLGIGALLAPLFGLLGACEYSATVRNDSQRTVVAELEHDRFLAETLTKRSALLEPGDEATLGPYKIDPLEPLTLRIRIVDDVFGGWQSERLEPGHQMFVIDDGTLQSWEAVAVRRVPTD